MSPVRESLEDMGVEGEEGMREGGTHKAVLKAGRK
jgi:hypothetical protein